MNECKMELERERVIEVMDRKNTDNDKMSKEMMSTLLKGRDKNVQKRG